jgi:hypothetical protein
LTDLCATGSVALIAAIDAGTLSNSVTRLGVSGIVVFASTTCVLTS